jgi:hypothetical protein
MSADEPVEFGKRRPAPIPPTPPKRSHKVVLLLMGTVAVGGAAYALMPKQNCDAEPSAMTQESADQCAASRSSSSSHGGSGSSQRSYGGGSSDAGASHTERGGFGSFAHAFTSHFSGGG